MITDILAMSNINDNKNRNYMKNHKELTTPENMKQLRTDIMRLMLECNESISSLSRKIGIHPMSLRKFTKEEGSMHILTLMKIDEYVKSFLEKK